MRVDRLQFDLSIRTQRSDKLLEFWFAKDRPQPSRLWNCFATRTELRLDSGARSLAP
jgi:hypothetical protein